MVPISVHVPDGSTRLSVMACRGGGCRGGEGAGEGEGLVDGGGGGVGGDGDGGGGEGADGDVSRRCRRGRRWCRRRSGRSRCRCPGIRCR